MKWTFVFLMLINTPVFATNSDGRYNGSPYAAWFAEQHNYKGGWCCDGYDGHYYDGDYVFEPDGSVDLKMADRTVHIAANLLVDPSNPDSRQKNPTGHAVWWYSGDVGNTENTYCFAPGPEGMIWPLPLQVQHLVG